MKRNRLLAFFIDYILVLLIFVPISILINLNSTEENSNRPFEIFYPLLFLVLFVFYNRDLIDGRSIGKRIVGIGVRDQSNVQHTPGIIRLFFRNVPLILWPLELLFFIITGRRLGDRLLKTKVVELKKKVLSKEEETPE
ncbi:putative RDD family membrane protein YckC [Paenibacillus sp. BK720]|nr:putative RDD family membrane protein YckC [Paenibacillus sp. BK720]